PLPIVNAGADTTLCNQPIGVQFSGSPVGGTWSGTGVTSTGLFTPTGSGTYSLTYTYTIGVTGCTDSDTKIVTVVDPTVANAGPDREICIDNTAVPVIGTPASGTWTGTGVTPTGNFSIATAGTFELVFSNGQGNCLTR